MTFASDLCHLAGLIRFKPYKEMVMVGETPDHAEHLINTFSTKYRGHIIVLFCNGRAYVKGLGLHFCQTVSNRDEFIATLRGKAARLTDQRLEVDWDENLWKTFYKSQTIEGRKRTNPRWCMPKKFDKSLNLQFEASQFARQGNMNLNNFLGSS